MSIKYIGFLIIFPCIYSFNFIDMAKNIVYTNNSNYY